MKIITKTSKRIMSFMALLVCVTMVLTLLVLPAGTVSVAADGDVYANQLVSYSFNDECTGHYFTPIAPGKYPTFIMMCGKGGPGRLRSDLRYFINEWVKAGYFPPMNVVIPNMDNFDGLEPEEIINFGDFFYFTKKDHMLGLLLEKIESGQLSSQIDTSQDILLAGFSQGGMCALQCGAEFNTRLKKIGALSPAAKFWVSEGDSSAYYPYKKDIFFSKDPDAFVFMSAGPLEGDFTTWMNGFEYAIASNGNNKSGLVYKHVAPESWGGHAWPMEKKEIFMYLWRAFNGEYLTASEVDEKCDGSYKSGSAPTVITPAQEYQIHPAPSFTVSPYQGSKLVNLDMSTYAKDTTTDPVVATGSVGNVKNTGTLASSTKVKMSSKSGTTFGLDMTKKSFTNNKGTKTYYLEREVNDSTTGISNNYMMIDEPSLETRANTISFWAKYTPVNKAGAEYSFFDYNVTSSGESEPTHLVTFDQKATTSGQFVLNGRYGKTGRWDDTQYGDVTDKAAGKWAQFTITNPTYELNGKKTIKVYVNGEYLYSKIVTKPSGTATDVKLTFGGENSPGEDLYWPDDFTLGNVTVYDGALSAEEIYSEYNLNKDYYTAGTSSLPDITGYTFNDSTVNYDGASHNITVTAGSGATSGVTTTYTCNGAAFNGATAVGTYYVTAKISKSGYNDLYLNATLKINGQDITGYTFSNSTVTYNGSNQMINVVAASGATQGVTTTYTCNGVAFSGATKPGTYPVTATITKAGYNPLELSAVLKIKISSAPFVHDKYLELDMTNLSAQRYAPTASSVEASSGITKSGSWADGTELGFSRRPNDDENNITKGSIANAAGGTTYYLDFIDYTIYPHIAQVSSYLQHLTNLQMHNTAFESADNTISFWLDASPSFQWKQLLCYRVDYTSGSSKDFESFDLGINADGTWNAVSAPKSNNPASAATDAFSVPDGWKHVLITNPKSSGGKKTMNVYINGALKKTVTLDIPSGATIDRATISFFSKSINAYTSDDGPWRTREAIAPDGKIGDFKIYQGVLTGNDVPSEYYGGVSRFMENTGEPILEDITGYTFSNSTVAYDGASHMINVTAGSNATQGVTITYTSNGAAFSGATAVGTYPVTATITKEGYDDLVLSATLTIVDASNPPSGDLLLELDMSNFSAQVAAPSATSGEVTSGIVKSGTMASSTTLSFSKRPDAQNNGDINNLEKGSFQNNDNGTTYYIDFSDPKIKPVSTNGEDYDGHLTNVQFFNNSLESVDNTISFWIKDIAAHPTYMKHILCYRVDYNTSGCKSFDLVVNPDGTWNVISEAWTQLTNGFHSPVTSGAFEVPDGWKHVVITNPKRSGGSKTMELYVNGQFKKSITLSIPDDATINHATVSFFSKSTAEEDWWRARRNVLAAAKLSEVKVYDTALSASDVAGLYAGSINKFTEGSGTPSLQNITGYTFTNSTVTYDGASHMINVQAGQGATEGVTVTYTSNGAAFSGATAVGTYPVTATITKSGYTTLTLNATLTINPATITGYTFSDSTVAYDGASHMINVQAGQGATEGVTVTYTSNGAAFSGATAAGSYPVTATISKAGYADLVLSATLTIVDASNPPSGDLLLDLDMSGFSAQLVAPSATSGEVTSGIVKSGTMASSTTISFSQRPSADDNNSLTKGSFQNNDNGTTYYIDFSDSKIKPVSTGGEDYDGHLMNMQFFNNNLEAVDNTISFWVKDIVAHPTYMKQILCYRVDYNTSGCKSFDLVVNPDGTWNVISEAWVQLTNGFHSPVTDGAFSVPDGWKHVVITNPKRSGGSKTMELYVNGQFKKSITLSIPDDATINHATVAFFSKSTAEEDWWRARRNILAAAKLSGIKVYDSALSASDVADEYAGSISRYTEKTENTEKFGIDGTISAGSEISASYTLDAGEEAPVVIIAVYDADGGVVRISAVEAPVDGKVTATLNFGAGENTTGYTAKAFVWKDFITLVPLQPERVFE